MIPFLILYFAISALIAVNVLQVGRSWGANVVALALAATWPLILGALLVHAFMRRFLK